MVGYIYPNLPRNTIDYYILGAEIARARKYFQHPLLTRQPATMTQSAQTIIFPTRLSCSKIKWYAIYIQIYQQACDRGTFKKLEFDTVFSAGSITVGAERKIWFLHPLDHWKMLFPKSGKYFAINKSYQIYNFLLFLYQPSNPCITFTNPNTDFFSQKKTIIDIKSRKITCLYQEMPYSDYPILGVETIKARKRFQYPLLTRTPATMTLSAQTIIPPNYHMIMGLRHSKIKW